MKNSPDKPKFVDAKAMMGIMHEGKLINKGEPGYEEAVQAAAARAKSVEANSVEIDPRYQQEALEELEKRRRAAEVDAIRPSRQDANAMEITPGVMDQANDAIESGIRRGEMAIEEALRDLELERSVADQDGLAGLEAKEDLLTRARDAFRRQEQGVSQADRFNAIVEELQTLTQEGPDHSGHADAAIVINRAVESMRKL